VTAWTLGIPDGEFFQRKPERGLLTKAEVRVVALSKLAIRPDSTVWDIGGGAGSVTIEAALMATKGAVYVVEKNAEDCENIRENIAKFGTKNVTLVEGNAPDGLDAWVDPDAVFIGGSGGRMNDILDVSAKRLRPGGRIVIDVATIENLGEAVSGLKARGFEADVTMVSISRSKPILNLTRFDALNPVFIVTSRGGTS
jgi:precorrin-6Y C5,15-methyltransferase (decarboxylating)